MKAGKVLSFLVLLILVVLVQPVPAATGSGNPYEEFRIPWAGSQPLGICVDRAGKVWFGDDGTNRLVGFDPVTSTFSPVDIPNNETSCEIWSIVQDSAGALWFGDAISNAIWSFDPTTGVFTRFPVPTRDSYPFQLAFDSNGTLWFTELYGGKIGELRKGSTIREYPTPTLSSAPNGLDIGVDGRVWFVEGAAKQLVSFDPATGEFAEIQLGDMAGNPRGFRSRDREISGLPTAPQAG